MQVGCIDALINDGGEVFRFRSSWASLNFSSILDNHMVMVATHPLGQRVGR